MDGMQQTVFHNLAQETTYKKDSKVITDKHLVFPKCSPHAMQIGRWKLRMSSTTWTSTTRANCPSRRSWPT